MFAQSSAPRRRSSTVASLFAFVLSLSFTHGRLVNITIDDSFSVRTESHSPISYEPSEAWNDGTRCDTGCTAHPGSEGLCRGTWHDSTFYPTEATHAYPNIPLNATVTFNGSAVYVYCALVKALERPYGNSDMRFFIDGAAVGAFLKEAPGTAGYDYGVLVYSNNSMSPGEHTLKIQNGRPNGRTSILLLDSVVYSTEQPEPHSSSGPPAGLIAGVVVGVVAFLGVLGVLGFIYRRRCKSRRNGELGLLGMDSAPANVTPFVVQPPGHQRDDTTDVAPSSNLAPGTYDEFDPPTYEETATNSTEPRTPPHHSTTARRYKEQ